MSICVFYWHCSRLGLTLAQTSLADTFCVVMGTKYDRWIQQMDNNPSLLEKFKILSE